MLRSSCLLEHLTVPTQGDCTPETLFQVLIRAASKQDSIEHTTQRLTGVPTGNTIRYHLDKLDDMTALERQLNQTLHPSDPTSRCQKQTAIGDRLASNPVLRHTDGSRIALHLSVSSQIGHHLVLRLRHHLRNCSQQARHPSSPCSPTPTKLLSPP